jgi:hypothetical protein
MHVVGLVYYCNSLRDSFGFIVNNVQVSDSFYKLDSITLASRCAEHREIATSCLGVTCNKWKEKIISRSTPLVSAPVTPLRGFFKLPADVYIRTYCLRAKGYQCFISKARERLERNVIVLLFKTKKMPTWLSCLRNSSAFHPISMSNFMVIVIVLVCLFVVIRFLPHHHKQPFLCFTVIAIVNVSLSPSCKAEAYQIHGMCHAVESRFSLPF